MIMNTTVLPQLLMHTSLSATSSTDELFVLLEGHTSLIYFLELSPRNFTSENEYFAPNDLF